MMDWTDRHCRFFHRLLSPHARLYTEMVTTGALLHGDRQRFLAHHPREHPVALQLGGHEPVKLAEAARYGEEAGFDEINLNVGCPSDRVQSGRFGACLMREPLLVGECVSAMQSTVKIPITVKCRIGVDNQDDFADLQRFTDIISQAGCLTLIVHARKAWLQGLSPKENREIPPLNYERVYQLKQEFPQLTIVLNGGINSINAVETHLQHVDGVMLGRAAYHYPYLLAQLEKAIYATKLPTRKEILYSFKPYIEEECMSGRPLASITRHLLGLYHEQPGARTFRRILSEQAHQKDRGFNLIEQVIDLL